MALTLLTNPATPPVANPADWNNFVDREDKSNRGAGTAIDTISLTLWDASTTRPEIAQGSVIEVGGSMYLADSDTALTDDGGLADGLVHIKLVPSGGTVIPTLTSDSIPAWDAQKGGWYDSDDKFLPIEMTRSGPVTKVYSNKIRFPYQNKTYSFSSVGDADFDGAISAGGAATFGGGGSFGGNVSVTGNVTATVNMDAADFETSGGAAQGTSGFTTGNGVLKWQTFTGASLAGTPTAIGSISGFTRAMGANGNADYNDGVFNGWHQDYEGLMTVFITTAGSVQAFGTSFASGAPYSVTVFYV